MLYIHGIGHFHPDNEISNGFLEELDIGTNEEWILDRVGIRSRRTVLSLDYIRETKNTDPRGAIEASVFTNAETGAKAAEMAIRRAGITADAIGMVLCGGCSPQWTAPAEASTVAAALEIEAPCLDVATACSTFASQLDFLAMTQPEKLPDYVLLVQPENNTRCVDYSDRSTAVLWGDASAAAIVSARVPKAVTVAHSFIRSNPRGWTKVRIPSGGHFEQDGRAVQRFAIKEGSAAVRELLKHVRGDGAAASFIGHQANLLVLHGICRRAEIAPDRHHYNVDDYGNCGAAGAPSVLSQAWEKFGPGDTVAVAVVGAGLTWGGALIEFE